MRVKFIRPERKCGDVTGTQITYTHTHTHAVNG